MSQFLRTSLIALGLSLAASVGFAQQVKIGMVNAERILSESKSAVAATNRLKTEFSGRETQLTKEGAALKTAIEKYQKDAPTMSESARATREKQLVAQEEAFQNKRAQFQEDLATRRNKELEQIQDKARGIIKQIAEAGNYTLIVSAEAVVYTTPQSDITTQVIQRLDSGK